jgi:hypothetical protein
MAGFFAFSDKIRRLFPKIFVKPLTERGFGSAAWPEAMRTPVPAAFDGASGLRLPRAIPQRPDPCPALWPSGLHPRPADSVKKPPARAAWARLRN